jgi:hypothetical protein
MTDVNTREGLYKQQMGEIEHNLTPYLRDDGQEPEFEVINGDLWLLEDDHHKNVQKKMRKISEQYARSLDGVKTDKGIRRTHK